MVLVDGKRRGGTRRFGEEARERGVLADEGEVQ